MGVARKRLLRNLLSSLGLIAVLAAISIGLPAVDRALPAGRPVTAGEPYPVGAGVTIVPPSGAQVDVTKTRREADRGKVLFLVGSVRYAIVVAPFDGSLSAAADQLRRKIRATRGYQVAGGEKVVRTAGGLAGVQGGYTAPGRSGRYAVFLVDGRAIEVTISGAAPELRAALRGVERSTASLAYEAAS